MPRRTLAGPASFEGPALHTGGVTHLVARPGAPGQGIRFRRTDLPGSPEVAAELAAVEATERRTALGAAPATIHTVEHVLAALNALELDDLTLELDGPEPPILDGSFGPFVEGFVRAGIREHPGGVTTFRLRAPVDVQAGDASYRAEPHPGLRLSVTLAFDHPAIGVQRGTWDVTPDGFRRELAAARTFGLLREVEALRARGLALGASHANAIALDDHGVVGTTLRWPDEFVRHKAGDLVGDLALLGGRLHAHVRADRPSHHGNVALARALAAAAVKEIVT